MLYLAALAAAVLITVVRGWTGWFLLIIIGALAFAAHRPDDLRLLLLGSLLLTALVVETVSLQIRKRYTLPNELIKRTVISGGTQLALGSLFGITLGAVAWWTGLGRFLWDQPAETLDDEARRIQQRAKILVLRLLTSLAGAAVIIGFK